MLRKFAFAASVAYVTADYETIKANFIGLVQNATQKNDAVSARGVKIMN